MAGMKEWMMVGKTVARMAETMDMLMAEMLVEWMDAMKEHYLAGMMVVLME